MKIFQKILERRLKKLITINNIQFGFSSGKGTKKCSINHTTTASNTPRSAKGFVYLWKKAHGSGILVSEKDRS